MYRMESTHKFGMESTHALVTARPNDPDQTNRQLLLSKPSNQHPSVHQASALDVVVCADVFLPSGID